MAVNWQNNCKLNEDLKKYVAANMQRVEILDYMKKDYAVYKWSLRTLDCRLNHFNIRYIVRNVPLEVAREAVRKELNGPGAMLGYRAMTQKMRQKYELKVPRALVHNLMFELGSRWACKKSSRCKKEKGKGALCYFRA